VFVFDKFDLHSRRWLQLKKTLQAHSRQDFSMKEKLKKEISTNKRVSG